MFLQNIKGCKIDFIPISLSRYNTEKPVFKRPPLNKDHPVNKDHTSITLPLEIKQSNLKINTSLSLVAFNHRFDCN